MTNEQIILDKAVTAIIEQGESSFIRGECKYRGPDGRMCALGHCIADSFYDRCFEGRTPLAGLGGLIIEAIMKSNPELDQTDPLDELFLDSLQKVHDRPAEKGLQGPEFVAAFKDGARALAESYKLEWKYD